MSDIRDASLLSAACVVGAVVTPVMSFVGLPLVAAGAVALTSRGRWALAAIAAVVGVAVAALIQASTLVFVLPAVAGVLAAAVLIRRVSYQVVAVVLAFLISITAFGMDAVTALMAGKNVVAEFALQASAFMDQLNATLQASGSANSAEIETLAKVAASLWPSGYVQLGILTVFFVMTAMAWAARRSGVRLPIPPMSSIDLNVNVVWLPIAALLALAAGLAIGGTGPVFLVGLNLLLIARPLLLIQGVAVCAWMFDRVGLRGVGRSVGYVMLVGIDTFVPIVSLLGLADFWANPRKLPRDGVKASIAEARENEN
ncbi:MAG: DUF2232 domain-containing protein [Coriobacteriales bacterium]|nr:DUF2232 domain-containing protein [Coriobacteriales bacterium]